MRESSRRHENRLLIASCRRSGQGEDAGARPDAPDDWNRLVDRATALGIVAHLRQYLRQPGQTIRAPAAIAAHLDRLYYADAAHVARLQSALGELLTAFARDGIDVVMLKGAALGIAVYDNVALRPMRDLDLLVRPNDLAAAGRALETLGYEPNDWYRPAAWYEANHHHLVPYISRARGSLVEVHRDLVPRECGLTIPVANIWRRTQATRVGATPVLVPAPDDLLFHLCVHLAASDHFFAGLRTLRDMAEVVARTGPAFRWDRLVETAERSGASRHVLVVLRLARSIGGVRFPTAAEESLIRQSKLSPAEEWWLMEYAERMLCRWPDEPGSIDPGILHAAGEALLSRDPWPRRVATVARAGWELWRAPDSQPPV